jgi:hypothetical protein
MDEEIATELYDVITERVDLVGVPANRRMWAIAKEVAGKDVTMAEEKKEVQPVTEQPVEETVKKADFEALAKEKELLKGQIEALRKESRMKDLTPLCKDLGLDADKVWKLEQVDKESADYFVGKLDEARKQNVELMKELGTASGQPTPDEFMVEAQKVAKADNSKLEDAIVKVAKANPDLYAEYTNRIGKKAR